MTPAKRQTLAWTAIGAAAAVLVLPGAVGTAPEATDGGVFRVAFARHDNVDPALAYSNEARALLETTCARLLTYATVRPRNRTGLTSRLSAALRDRSVRAGQRRALLAVARLTPPLRLVPSNRTRLESTSRPLSSVGRAPPW